MSSPLSRSIVGTMLNDSQIIHSSVPMYHDLPTLHHSLPNKVLIYPLSFAPAVNICHILFIFNQKLLIFALKKVQRTLLHLTFLLSISEAFSFLFWPHCMWDLGSSNQGWNPCPLQWKRSLDHRTAREVPQFLIQNHVLVDLMHGQ